MRTRNGVTAGLLAVSLVVMTSGADAQSGRKARAPFVHVYSRAAGVVSNYVEPSIEVGEDAYVFAVAIDLDGQIQVLHPEYSGLSVRVRGRRELQLKNFFAGFNEDRGGAYSRGSYSRSNYYSSSYGRDYREDDIRGVIIALASRAPFKFDRLETGGDWDIPAIRRLVEHRTPSLAATNLAHYVGAAGEPIGQDFMRFAGQSQSRYAYIPEAYLSPCDLFGGYNLGPTVIVVNRGQSVGRAAGPPGKGLTANIVGFDACGRPIVAYTPSGPGSPRLPGRIPQFPHDTTVFPKTQGIPATGAFPSTRRAGTVPGYPGAKATDERAAGPRVILGEPRRRAEPKPAPAEPVYAEPVRSPRVERAPAPEQIIVTPKSEPRVINEPAQGSFGSSRGRQDPAPQPRIIESPAPVHHEQPVQRAEPVRRESPPQRSEPVSAPAPAPPPRSEPTQPPPSRTEPAPRPTRKY